MVSIGTNVERSMPSKEVIGVGGVRKHGTARSNGMPVYEYCLSNEMPTTPMIRDAVENDSVLYIVVLTDGVDGIQIHNKPYVDRTGRVCVALHMKYNAIWERLWREGKPVLAKFVVLR